MPEKWTGRLIGRMHNERITYEQLANEMGVNKAYISMILNGKRKPPNIQKRMETALEAIIKRERGKQTFQQTIEHNTAEFVECKKELCGAWHDGKCHYNQVD